MHLKRHIIISEVYDTKRHINILKACNTKRHINTSIVQLNMTLTLCKS